jgi:hypothetical protein
MGREQQQQQGNHLSYLGVARDDEERLLFYGRLLRHHNGHTNLTRGLRSQFCAYCESEESAQLIGVDRILSSFVYVGVL